MKLNLEGGRAGRPWLAWLWPLLLVLSGVGQGWASDLALQVQLDPTARMLAVSAELAPPAGKFRFVLHRSLQVESARQGERPLTAQVVASDGELQLWQLKLPTTAEKGGRLQLRYRGQLPALEETLDHRQVLQQLRPMAGVRGSFLPAGSGWYPAPADLFSYAVELEVTGGQRALVAGRLVSEQVPSSANEAYRASFEFSQPASGIELMAGPWQVSELLHDSTDGRPLRLRTYFPAALQGQDGLAAAYLADSAAYIDRYSALIGPYPFTEFSVVAGPLPTGFGMPGLTYLGEQVLALPFIRVTSLGHEVLHNWWGNGVLVDYLRGNWAEGLTTFLADYAYAEEQGEDAARAMRLGWLRDHAASPDTAADSLRIFRSRSHGAAAALGYGKAAMVFVMLRDRIGAEAFTAGLRELWQAQRFRRASWADLERAFSTACNCALDGFFRHWLDQTGSGSITLTDARYVPNPPNPPNPPDSPRVNAGEGLLELDFAQGGSEQDWLLPITIEMKDGRRLQRWQALAAGERTVVLEVDAVPQAVGVDVDFRLWRRLPPAQLPLILRQWMLSPAPHFAVADEDPALERVATALAGRLFEQSAEQISPAALDKTGGEILLLGTHAALNALYARLSLPAPPSLSGEPGSAQVWTQTLGNGRAILVVAVRDAAAAEALLRPLPHYGGQSWLRFDGSRLLQSGVWPAAAAMLDVRQLGILLSDHD